jgi:poly(3-hydroxybutyrate) depolymerase
MRRWLLRILLSLLLLVVLVHCASRTESPPLPPGVKKEHTKVDLADRRVSGTLYKPAKDDNAPLIVVVHGFLRSKRYMAGWGGHLAAEGFLVAVPTQPAFAEHALNGHVLAALVEKYRDKRRVALMGFSMGGLTTLLATTHKTFGVFNRISRCLLVNFIFRRFGHLNLLWRINFDFRPNNEVISNLWR